MARAVKASRSITTLAVIGGGIPDTWVKDWANAIDGHPTLLEFHFNEQKISTIGAKQLLRAALRSPNLIHLSLARNRLGDRGARGLAETMRLATSSGRASAPLHHLDLSDTGITNKGADSLTHALQSCKLPLLHLTGLVLSHKRTEKLLDALRG